ncbi:MAG: AAA family ATPase [Chloroflexota bacterium]
MTRRVTSPDFIGRRDDLALLERTLAEARDGTAIPVLVGGEAGVGKSRLVREVTRIAREAGMRVLAGACLDVGDGGASFAPFTALVRAWMREVGRPEALATAGIHAADLARLVPELRPSESVPGQERSPSARIHDALFELCARLAARSPLLLILEDLHWADADTLAATGALIRAFGSERVCLLITYRTDDLHRRHPLVPWLAEVTRAVRPVRIELDRLGADEIRALVAGVLGAEPSADLVRAIQRRSDGNPFFAEELLAAGGADAYGAGLSASLRELLSARMDAVSDGARRVLGVIAVVGRPVDDDLLVAIEPGSAPELRAGLRELIDAALVVPVDDERYGFRHALVQEAAYEDLLPGERRSMHRAVALQLEAVPAAGEVPAAEIARHWRGARDRERALRASVRAGDEAALAFAFAQAAVEYDHALDAWEQVPDPGSVAGIDRIELLRRTARALHLSAEDRRAVELLRTAVELSRATPDATRTGVLLEHLGRVSWIAGDTPAAIAFTEEALAVMPLEPPTAERARAVAGLGQLQMLSGHFASAVERCREAIGIAQAVGALEPEGHALNTLGIALANLGRSVAGVTALERALVIGRGLRNADDIGRAYVNLVDALLLCGRPALALERAREGAAEADRLGVGSVYGFYIRMGGVTAAQECGDWETARSLLAEAGGRLLESEGVERYRLGYSMLLLVTSGHPEAQASWARAAQVIPLDPAATTTGYPPQLGGIELACWEGRPRDGIAIADDGLERLAAAICSPILVRLARMGTRAAADLVAVEGPGARPEAEAAIARFREQALSARAAMTEPGPELVRWMDLEARSIEADAARAAGGVDAASWAELATGWAEAGYAYEALLCRARAAVASADAGDPAGPAALRDARSAAEALGARPLAEWLGGAARRLGLRLEERGAGGATRREAAHRPYGLTARELEVLRLVTDGRSNRQIADELGISENTAGVHVSNILGKLGVTSRTEAARVGFGLGLAGDTGGRPRP